MRVAISVLIATRNRAPQLLRVLHSLQQQSLESENFEVIVIDNGSEDNTNSALEGCLTTFPLVRLFEPRVGKSYALNCGLDAASGSLIVFTDDDVTASPEWLESLWRATQRFPAVDVLCGPIVPDFPPVTPEWLHHHFFASALFGRFEPGIPEGPLPACMLPFGANFAARHSAISGERFRLDLGPSRENGPLFCEDTEFLQRFRCEGRQFVFVPAAQVTHHVSPEQTQPSSICERAFHFGRGIFSYLRKPQYFHVPLGFAADSQDESPQRQLERGALINYYCGQLCQGGSEKNESFAGELLMLLERLGIRTHEGLLCACARTSYRRYLEQL